MKKTLIVASAVLALSALSAMSAASAVTFVDLNLSAFHKPCSSVTTTTTTYNQIADSAISREFISSGGGSTSTSITSLDCDRDARNIGLGLEFQTESRVGTALVGFNLGNWNEYVVGEWAPIQHGDRKSNFSVGLLGGVAHTDGANGMNANALGNGNYLTGGLIVSANRNKYGINLVATPTVNNVPAFVGLQLRYRLGSDPKPVAVVFTPAPVPFVALAPAPTPEVVKPAPVVIEEVIVKHGRE